MRRVGFFDITVVLAFLSLVCFQMDEFADDPGVGWHLETGKIVSESLQPPRYDPFLWSAQQRSWVSDQWLSDLLLFQGYAFGGFPLLYGAIVLLYLATYFLVLFPGLSSSEEKKSGAHLLAAACASLIAFKLGQIHFILRPVVMSFFLFALVFTLLLEFTRNPESSTSGKKIVLIAGIFFLWTNLHPSFVLGIVLIGLYLLSLIMGRLFRGNQVELRVIKKGALLLGTALLATLLNPYGLRLHESVLFLGGSSYFMQLNEEWYPLDPSAPEGVLVLVIIVVSAPLIWTTLRAPSLPRLFTWVCALPFLYWTFRMVRFCPYFGIVSAPLVAEALLMGGSKARSFFNHFSTLDAGITGILQREVNSGKGRISLAIVFVLVMGGLAVKGAVPGYEGSYGPSAIKYPYEEVKFIRSRHPSSSLVVLAKPEWGGFITWQGDSSLKPVIDDRNTLLGEEMYRDYIENFERGGDIKGFISRNPGEYALVPLHAEIVTRLQELDCSEVYSGPVAKVFDIEGCKLEG